MGTLLSLRIWANKAKYNGFAKHVLMQNLMEHFIHFNGIHIDYFHKESRYFSPSIVL